MGLHGDFQFKPRNFERQQQQQRLTCRILHRFVTHSSSTQGWYIPNVMQLNRITSMEIRSNHGFVISNKHQLRGRVSCRRYFSATSGKPGYGRFGSPDDELVSLPLHELSVHVDPYVVDLELLVSLFSYVRRERPLRLLYWPWCPADEDNRLPRFPITSRSPGSLLR